MYKPTLEEFKTKAREGNLIPVYKEVLADLETPVSAFLKLGDNPFSFLLESVEGGDKWARYSFLGCDPSTVISLKGSKVEILEGDKKESKETGESHPLDYLKKMLSKYKPVDDPTLPRFSGGAVGFICYDMVRYYEELPDNTEDDLNLPDAVFVVADTLLIFDDIFKKIKIVSNAFIENDNLEEAYQKAIDKIDSIEKKLLEPLKTAPFPKPSGKKMDPDKIESNFEKEEFKKSVQKIKDYIKEGDVIQTVLAQRLKFDVSQDPFTIYRALRTVNPSPYMYYLNFGETYVVGASPEVLVRVEDDFAETRPIAGTRPRGENELEDRKLEEELLNDQKELAEHIMLVDLGRNDLGRVAKIGSVKVNESFSIERYSHVMHIVSNVQCRLKEGMDCFEALKSTFPAGTLSGAPKIRAMEIIDELEPTRRGIYGGAVGYIGFSGNLDAAIAIRTLVIKNNAAYLGVGAGIVADSDPEKEFEETMNKGKALLKAIELAERGLVL
jgi:anthranilate synthase component I